MAKATTKEIEVTKIERGYALELNEAEATLLYGLLGNSSGRIVDAAGFVSIWKALLDVLDERDCPRIGYEIVKEGTTPTNTKA